MPKPSFLVIGAQKAGTTTLHHYLSEHPSLFLSNPKELHFFDADHYDWDHIDYAAYERHFDKASPAHICGEITPAYMFQRRFLERIQAYDPKMHLIVILRNPIERAFSGWRMEVSRQAEVLPFSAAVREGRARVAEDWRTYSYVERGFYAEQIETVFSLFPAKQCHFLLTDDMAADPDMALAGICSFLGCPALATPLQRRQIQPIPVRDLGGMDPADALYLRDIYAEDIRKTAAFLGRDLGDWLRLPFV